MFDFTSSKLLLLGIVALLVIGPKDLPALLRTLGKYMGIVRRHANDFRAQFDEAMRESELQELKKQVETIREETEAAVRSAEQSVQTEVDAAKLGVDSAMDDPAKRFTDDAMMTPETEALPVAAGGGAAGAAAPLNGSTHTHAAETAPVVQPAVETAGTAAPTPDKSGA